MKKMLFVCTGNTCRSPMAEAIFNRLAGEKGIKWQAASCGIFANAGDPATDNAVLALRELGIDLSRHKARRVSGDILRDADMICCVTRRHLEWLQDAYPDQNHKIELLGEEIPDPFGADLDSYRKTAEALRRAVLDLILEIQDGV